MSNNFHLDDKGPRLIGVNTNAGGAFLSAFLAKAQRACCTEMEEVFGMPSAADFNIVVLVMFAAEWIL